MNSDINPTDLKGLESSEQKKLMKEWFLRNFEDPAERTPYESAEGGYIWIWGGPYNARQELLDYFYSYVDKEIIDELALELESQCLEWAPTEESTAYDNYVVDDISRITEAYQNFSGSIRDIKKLMEIPIPNEVACNFYRLLFVNVITALETFLSDAFIFYVMGKDEYFERFVKSNPKFKKQKFPLSEVIEVAAEIKSIVKTHLLEVVWHNLNRVSKMYKGTLAIQFPDESGDIYRAILKRHDIVHRNGKSKDGDEIVMQKDDIKVLIDRVEKFAQEVDSQLAEFDC